MAQVNIEILVSHSQGSQPHVSSYQGAWPGGSGVRALNKAIKEAEAFIAGVKALKAELAKHGIGELPPPSKHRPRANFGQLVADVFEKTFKGKLPHVRL